MAKQLEFRFLSSAIPFGYQKKQFLYLRQSPFETHLACGAYTHHPTLSNNYTLEAFNSVGNNPASLPAFGVFAGFVGSSPEFLLLF